MVKTTDQIVEEIKKLADEKYKEFHSGLCPETDNILGIRVPILRNYAKSLMDEDWKQTYKNIGNKYYEETMLKGMMIGISNLEINERLEYIKNFVPLIKNWAVCDVICSGFKFTKKNEEIVWNFLKQYLESNEEFEIRFAVVMILNFYITDKYIDDVLKILDNVKHKEMYYVRMAVAWTISVIYLKYFEKATIYLEKTNNLDNETYNKALQKIIESNRVGKREKNKMRRMKRSIEK